jgi:hypothetical protein
MKILFLISLLAIASSAMAQMIYAGPQVPITDTYFGVDCNIPTSCIGSATTPSILLTADASVDWYNLETSSGVFTWGNLDTLVSSAATAGFSDILYVLGLVPTFNSSNPSDSTCVGFNGACDPNSSTTEFNIFTNAITQRYCGKIRYWEGWNEANSASSWNASVGLLASYMTVWYNDVHSTSNCACVGTFNSTNCSPGKAGGTNPNFVLIPPIESPGFFTAQEENNGSAAQNTFITWLGSYIAAGGGTLYDIAGLHSYGPNATCYPSVEAYMTDVASLKQVLASASVPNMPIWATEMNWGMNNCLSNTDAVLDAWIARDFLLHYAMGFQRAIWYDVPQSGPIEPYGFGSIIVGSNQAVTYGEMQKWMIGAIETNCQSLSGGNWICQLTRSSPSGYVAYAVWNPSGSGSYTVPSGVVQYRNVLNTITSTSGGSVVSLTASPLLFETVSGAF